MNPSQLPRSASAPLNFCFIGRVVHGIWYEVSTKSIPEGEEPGEPIHGVLVKKTDDWPVLGTVTTDTRVVHGKVSDESYELVNVDGRQFRIATQKYELQQGEKSRWSGLPLIGGLFNNDQYVTRRVEQAVPIENVICVRQCSLYDLKNHRAIPGDETPEWFRN